MARKFRFKFPHELDTEVENLNKAIEDNAKFNVDFSRLNADTPSEKWIQYQKMALWVSFCEKAGIELGGTRVDIYRQMMDLWMDIRLSDIYHETEKDEIKRYPKKISKYRERMESRTRRYWV